jgi:hypothetical protein
MKISLLSCLIGLLSLPVLQNCSPAERKESTISSYNLGEPEKFFMPESLTEISGIAFNNGINDTIYAIQDEEGKLFKMATGVKKQINSRFGKNGDYEDVTILNGEVIVLKSSGQLISFPLAESSNQEIGEVKQWGNLLPKGEFESLYGDEKTGVVYTLCKACPGDRPKESISGFHFKPGDTHVSRFAVNVVEIKNLAGKMKTGFKPSGFAMHPLTGEWYIISSVNKLLVITDHNWDVTAVTALDARSFSQPEGIAFDKQGNLYISNEGTDMSAGNILKFKRLKNH